MSCFACSSDVLRGSVSEFTMPLYFCGSRIVASSAIATTIMSRPSPFCRCSTLTRSGRIDGLQVAVDVLAYVKPPGVPTRPRNRRGGYLVGRGRVVDQFGRDARVLQVFLDLLGVLLVDLLRLDAVNRQ